MLKGTSVLNIVSMGKVLKLDDDVKIEISKFSNIRPKDELDRYFKAVKEFEIESNKIIKDIEEKAGINEASIIEGHILMANDSEIIKSLEEKLKNNNFTIEWSVMEVFNEYVKIFESMDDELMKQRISDLNDVKIRLLNILQGKYKNTIKDIKDRCIIVCRDLKPSQTSFINKDLVLGIVTEVGGKTSHTAILSKAMGIPAILGISNLMNMVEDGDFIIIDGNKGEVIINPCKDDIEKYRKIINEQSEEKKTLDIYKSKETYTKDGIKICLWGNMGTLYDLSILLENGAEGIGLFRTEFLYMDRNDFPTEEEQFKVYKKVAETLRGKPILIRTLDIGGDKDLPYFDFNKEENPFLGYRAIRICLDKTNIFKVQLKALLRASVYGNIKIMLPMIVNLQEINKSKEIIEEVKNELTKDNIKFNRNIEIGIMIETPSAAIISDILAKESCFFSIGTNDLIQYTNAVDRGNGKVSYLYTEYNPAILRLIKNIVKIGKENNILVGMCGEVAQNKYMIPFLIGIGLEEFSVSPSAILETRRLISKLSYNELKNKVDKILSLETDIEVFNYLETLQQ